MNYWQGKRILWMGTSIPEGQDTALGSIGLPMSYPALVGQLLGAHVDNISLGSSMCRASTRTGDAADGGTANILRAFSATCEEKEALIRDWQHIRHRLRQPEMYPQLGEEATTSREASFEHRLLPYLDGRLPMPDLFVIDHGHNDYKYTLPDGTSDITLIPSEETIRSGLLAPDTYMTGGGFAGLSRFLGDLSNVPDLPGFAAGLNRNCYIGSVSFICTLILHHNPRARFVFISNYEAVQKPELIAAQRYIADSWHFPLIEVWKKLGFSGHIIPGTAALNRLRPGLEDITAQQLYCPDTTHPHSDESGYAVSLYANAIASELARCV